MAEAEAGMLSEKQKMKSRAVEEYKQIQRERIEIAEKLQEPVQRSRDTAALGDLSDGQQRVYELVAF